MLIELNFEEITEVLKEIVFIDITIGKDGNIEIGIDACETTDKRPELSKFEFDSHF